MTSYHQSSFGPSRPPARTDGRARRGEVTRKTGAHRVSAPLIKVQVSKPILISGKKFHLFTTRREQSGTDRYSQYKRLTGASSLGLAYSQEEKEEEVQIISLATDAPSIHHPRYLSLTLTLSTPHHNASLLTDSMPTFLPDMFHHARNANKKGKKNLAKGPPISSPLSAIIQRQILLSCVLCTIESS